MKQKLTLALGLGLRDLLVGFVHEGLIVVSSLLPLKALIVISQQRVPAYSSWLLGDNANFAGTILICMAGIASILNLVLERSSGRSWILWWEQSSLRLLRQLVTFGVPLDYNLGRWFFGLGILLFLGLLSLPSLVPAALAIVSTVIYARKIRRLSSIDPKTHHRRGYLRTIRKSSLWFSIFVGLSVAVTTDSIDVLLLLASVFLSRRFLISSALPIWRILEQLSPISDGSHRTSKKFKAEEIKDYVGEIDSVTHDLRLAPGGTFVPLDKDGRLWVQGIYSSGNQRWCVFVFQKDSLEEVLRRAVKLQPVLENRECFANRATVRGKYCAIAIECVNGE